MLHSTILHAQATLDVFNPQELFKQELAFMENQSNVDQPLSESAEDQSCYNELASSPGHKKLNCPPGICFGRTSSSSFSSAARLDELASLGGDQGTVKCVYTDAGTGFTGFTAPLPAGASASSSSSAAPEHDAVGRRAERGDTSLAASCREVPSYQDARDSFSQPHETNNNVSSSTCCWPRNQMSFPTASPPPITAAPAMGQSYKYDPTTEPFFTVESFCGNAGGVSCVTLSLTLETSPGEALKSADLAIKVSAGGAERRGAAPVALERCWAAAGAAPLELSGEVPTPPSSSSRTYPPPLLPLLLTHTPPPPPPTHLPRRRRGWPSWPRSAATRAWPSASTPTPAQASPSQVSPAIAPSVASYWQLAGSCAPGPGIGTRAL